METSVNSVPSFNQDIFVPRLTFNRIFAAPDELPEYAGIKTNILDALNDAIAADPHTILASVARLEDQLACGKPIETSPFIAVKDKYDKKSQTPQPPYFGLISDALSITNNGSQFEFGDTPQTSDAGWAIVYNKCNEIDQYEISQAQSRVLETQTMLRRARAANATNQSDAQAEVDKWTALNTIAKQQRALMRLRALAVIARGPELEIPKQPTSGPEFKPTPRRRNPVKTAGRKLVQLSGFFNFL